MVQKKAVRVALSAAFVMGSTLGLIAGPVQFASAAPAPSVHLTYWTYYSPAQLAVTQFEKLHPNIHITVQVFPGNSYETKLQAALASGIDVPSMFDLDMGYIGKFINTPYVTNLSKMGANQLVKNMVPYVAAGGEMRNGNVGAITDTSSPGGFWYNRKAAKKWLGTENPNQVSSMIDTWQKIYTLGKKIDQKSHGTVHLLDAPGSVMAVEEYHTRNFVQNGKLFIGPAWQTILNEMRRLAQPGITANLPAMSASWGTSLNNHSPNPDAILYAIPSWAGFMINSKTANGQFGVAEAPAGYYEGGRYGAIYSHDTAVQKKAAYQFLQFLASPRWQNWNLYHTANMPSLISVYKQHLSTYKYPWFGGQDVLKMYYKISMDIPAQKQDQYEQDLVSDMGSVAATMIAEKKSNAWAIQKFKAEVQSTYPNVKIK